MEVEEQLQRQTAAVERSTEERTGLREAVSQAEGELKEARRREKHYIELIQAYMDSFRAVRKGFEGDEEWTGELNVLEDHLETLEEAYGLKRIDDESGPVNYDRHEVLTVLPAGEGAKDKTIAKLHRIGISSESGITLKALVTAFRA